MEWNEKRGRGGDGKEKRMKDLKGILPKEGEKDD